MYSKVLISILDMLTFSQLSVTIQTVYTYWNAELADLLNSLTYLLQSMLSKLRFWIQISIHYTSPSSNKIWGENSKEFGDFKPPFTKRITNKVMNTVCTLNSNITIVQ